MTTRTDDEGRLPCPIKGGIWRELARQTAKDRWGKPFDQLANKTLQELK